MELWEISWKFDKILKIFINSLKIDIKNINPLYRPFNDLKLIFFKIKYETLNILYPLSANKKLIDNKNKIWRTFFINFTLSCPYGSCTALYIIRSSSTKWMLEFFAKKLSCVFLRNYSTDYCKNLKYVQRYMRLLNRIFQGFSITV